jgi:hypothetical protein
LRGLLNMIGSLARNVQVRKEGWGLLFYSPDRHKVCFVRSGDWLYPDCFDGSATFEGLAGDVSRRTGAPHEVVRRSLRRLVEHLKEKGMIDSKSG